MSEGNSRCARCHRKLTDEESRKRGYGPVCWNKQVGKRERGKEQGRLFTGPELPFKGDIVLKRGENGEVLTNVAQAIIEHSPCGFEWGYGGSGPADLALNILAMYTDRETAAALHQVFKWAFIAKLPRDGGTIKGKDIRRWLREHRQDHAS